MAPVLGIDSGKRRITAWRPGRRVPRARSRPRGCGARDRRGSARSPAREIWPGPILEKDCPTSCGDRSARVLSCTCAYSNASRSLGSFLRLMTGTMTPSLLRVISPVTPLSSTPREAGERRDPGAKRRRAEREEVVVEVVADGDDDRGGDARPRAAPGGGAKAPRLPAESAAAARISGTAVIRDSIVSIPSPTTSEAEPSPGTAPKRTA